MDIFDYQNLQNKLRALHDILDNVQYKCEARQYTLEEDEMGKVFYCRDEIYRIFLI